MYLKSIDIVGYKSFADKTHLDLNPGITGIIGPNGCGKSNIMESVRWCLGEMSWKSLRADSMVDVIFAGTSKRPPLSMTEVTLTFDNASQMLPVQFSEVTISRRIYRSGESAYFLNKTQCRLRDIREMFLDTGVGSDGYAVIDQGGVDAMISAKPEERRAFFEEAAGVAKYKAKREEALRKLERVEGDLGRLQDSVTLIDEQVRKLDNDARKAKLYARYKEELAAMEAAHILQQMGQVDLELSQIQAKVTPLQEVVGHRKVEMDGAGAQLAALNLDKANQQNLVIDANQKIGEVRGELGIQEVHLKSAEQSIVDGDARAAACEVELASAQQRLNTIEPEIEQAARSVEQAQSARLAVQAELESWQREFDAISEGVAAARSQLDQVRSQTLKLQDENLKLHRDLSTSESTWSHKEGDVRRALRDLDKDLAQAGTARAEIAGLEAESAAHQARVAETRAAVEALEAKLAELRARQAALGDENVRLHSDLAGSKARAESIESAGGQNPYWVGAQTCLNSGIPGMLGTVRSLIKVEEWAKPALEDLLGERLYAVVCEDSAAARAGVELLQSSGKGRARFLVLTALPQPSTEARAYPPEARPLLSAVTYDPGHEKAVRFLLEEAYALDKALFGDHWVYGGAPQSESVQLSLSSLDEVRAGIAALETRGQELAAESTRLSEELAATETSLREATRAANEAAVAARSLEGRLQHQRHNLELHDKNVELSTGECASILAQMAEAKERIHELRKAVVEAERLAATAKQAEEDAARALSAANEELVKKQAGRESIDGRLTGAQERLDFYTKGFERLEEERKGHLASVDRRRQELEDLARRKQESVALLEQTKAKIQELNEQLARREQEAVGVHGRLQEIENDIRTREESLRTLREQHDTAQTELQGLEVSAAGLKARQEGLRTRLWEEWQLTADEARERYPQVVPDPQKIETLRKRIANMGNINMAAPEEYETLFQKQQHLTSQINDLNQAKEDLRAAIQKINATTRENFRTTFTEVREHFRKLYGVLFEGGEADLVLTDPDNILETGVEIVAQPPGKRLQSISLLSGGEKTLTAIALLFAFFMVKPSPFCMLDEADAALDDANIERFVSLLKQFQEKSQFLIVSHNKRTMEAADAIYGVTMEEQGVSLLVSVDFKKKASGEADAPRRPGTHGPFQRKKAAETPAAATAVLEAPAPAEAAAEPVVEAVAAPVMEPTDAPLPAETVETPVPEAAAPVVEEAPAPVVEEAAAPVVETPAAEPPQAEEPPKPEEPAA